MYRDILYPNWFFKAGLANDRQKMDDPRNVAATPQARYLTNDGFTCGYCTSDMPAGTNYVPVGPDSMCEDCFLGALKPQFLACLQSQASYPVTWGTLALDMADFPTFTPEEHAQWKSAVYEYATPQLYRLYCRHEYYYENGIKKYPDDQTAKVRVALAQKRGKKTGVDDLFVNRLEPTLPVGTDQTLTCSQCDKAWCARCGMKRPPALIVDFQNHLCTPPQPDLSEYDKLGTRGRDWQVCPNAACLRPATQDGGCNAMVCSCMTHYCYVSRCPRPSLPFPCDCANTSALSYLSAAGKEHTTTAITGGLRIATVPGGVYQGQQMLGRNLRSSEWCQTTSGRSSKTCARELRNPSTGTRPRRPCS